jgi:carbon storage regulator
MLVLSRKLGERIVIADDIVVTIVGINGNGVRLGIEAPHQVPVLRTELISRAATPGTGRHPQALTQ